MGVIGHGTSTRKAARLIRPLSHGPYVNNEQAMGVDNDRHGLMKRGKLDLTVKGLSIKPRKKV
jgi:hypothetical protein